jgi:Cu+-exporting ATPase
VRFVPSALPPARASGAPRAPVSARRPGEPASDAPLSEGPLSEDPAARTSETDAAASTELMSVAERALPERAPAAQLLAAILLGLVAAASSLLNASEAWRGVAVASALAACGALGLARLGRPAVGAAAGLVAPGVATLAAVCGWLFAPGTALESARAAGVVSAVAAGTALWLLHVRRTTAAQRFPLSEALGSAPRSGLATASELAPPEPDLKPGEEVVLRPGQRLHVDAVITAGQARVQPWPGSALRLARSEGEGLLAGAAVREGALRAVVRWVGHDRAWARLSLDPARRADRHVALARLAERLTTTGALGLGVVAAAVSVALDVHPIVAAANAASVAATLASVSLAELVALAISLGVSGLAARGICFRSAAALDRAGRTQSVVFCDRGTLLSGDLSVASIEPTSAIGDSELLSLLGGAYAGIASPLATALARSLAAHKLRADATRSPNHLPGLGVTAVASNGQPLVAGTRALLLERRISVASAESRIAELEALGRTVLLVALDGRWVGLVALQDGLRPGARAATQYLLEAGVEPILLSGEARETCRALARHVGIEHVRPEVLPHDRAAEVRRLARAGGMLAVVGSSIDDAALAAAPLSINIDPRGGPLERCDIDVVSGDVRDAALAIQLSRALAAAERSILIATTAPAALGLVALFAGLPAWGLPLLGLAGFALGARHLGDVAGPDAKDGSTPTDSVRSNSERTAQSRRTDEPGAPTESGTPQQRPE